MAFCCDIAFTRNASDALGVICIGESMIEQTPPDIMSTEERLNEIAHILARAGDRLKARAKEKNCTSLNQYLSRLRAESTYEGHLKRWS